MNRSVKLTSGAGHDTPAAPRRARAGARQPGFGEVIVRAQKRQHLRIYTREVLRTIEDRDN